MSWSLKDCTYRAAVCLAVGVHTTDQLDRHHLLAIIDRMRSYVRHMEDCPRCDCESAEQHKAACAGDICTCGFDQLPAEVQEPC